MPFCVSSGTTSSWRMVGMIVREIRSQFSVSEIGITGWKLSVYLKPSLLRPPAPLEVALGRHADQRRDGVLKLHGKGMLVVRLGGLAHRAASRQRANHHDDA